HHLASCCSLKLVYGSSALAYFPWSQCACHPRCRRLNLLHLPFFHRSVPIDHDGLSTGDERRLISPVRQLRRVAARRPGTGNRADALSEGERGDGEAVNSNGTENHEGHDRLDGLFQ